MNFFASLKNAVGLYHMVVELRNIGAQLKRLGDLYESSLGPSRSVGLKSFYQSKPGGESVTYTNDADMVKRERLRQEYFALTGIQLEEWELPPLEDLKGAS